MKKTGCFIMLWFDQSLQHWTYDHMIDPLLEALTVKMKSVILIQILISLIFSRWSAKIFDSTGASAGHIWNKSCSEMCHRKLWNPESM